MKVIQINTVCNNSTGKIMLAIQRKAEEKDFETISFVGRRKVVSDVRCEKIGNPISFWIHVAITTIFDKQGFGSYFHTKKLVQRLREEKADIIHLHNIHGYYLNIPVLFRYLTNEFSGKIFWTFHDCWPFTGHCPHFTAKNCNKWKVMCSKCPNKKEYPISFVLDGSSSNYRSKKKYFTELTNLEIITPSVWMSNLIKESFFYDYPIHVIHNGIDLLKFRYRPDQRVLDKYHIPDKNILLGVASIWEERKGLKDMLEIAHLISAEYVMVIVGLSSRQIRLLPDNVIGIRRTENTDELIAFYSSATIFINPSKEESFSLVTLEAMSCGTPSIVLNTSAVKELINNRNGVVLSDNTVNEYLDAIRTIEMKGFRREDVSREAMSYTVENMTTAVTDLYDAYGKND